MSVTNGVVQVEPKAPFKLLLANLSKRELRLMKGQVVATVLPHPTAVVPSHVHLADVLGIAETAEQEQRS